MYRLYTYRRIYYTLREKSMKSVHFVVKKSMYCILYGIAMRALFTGHIGRVLTQHC